MQSAKQNIKQPFLSKPRQSVKGQNQGKNTTHTFDAHKDYAFMCT